MKQELRSYPKNGQSRILVVGDMRRWVCIAIIKREEFFQPDIDMCGNHTQLTSKNSPAVRPWIPFAILVEQIDPGCFSAWKNSFYLGWAGTTKDNNVILNVTLNILLSKHHRYISNTILRWRILISIPKIKTKYFYSFLQQILEYICLYFIQHAGVLHQYKITI